MPVSILRRHGVEPEVLVSRLTARMRDMELRDERLKKRFELPPFLKHFATNLNLLARQDKLPPVFGRDKEIQQVLEILCHRERANSVMLIGEPGVGKTAIAEGLARRIEFEPETVPVRLRDCQVVNLQMNAMVAGHDAARDVRGSDPERDPRAEGAAEPDPVRRRGAHDGRRRLGARRAVGRRQHLQVGARARRDPDDRRDHAQRVQGVHPGRRGAGAPLPLRARSASRRSRRRGRSSTACGRGSSATTRCACSTRRSKRRSSCRRATCGTCTCPTRSSAGSTPRRCARRSIAAGK